MENECLIGLYSVSIIFKISLKRLFYQRADLMGAKAEFMAKRKCEI